MNNTTPALRATPPQLRSGIWEISNPPSTCGPVWGLLESPLHTKSMNWEAIITTLKLATATATILAVIGLPISYWVAFSKLRWKFLVEAVVALPLVLPPTVLGFYVLVAMGPRSPFGRWYESFAGHALPFTLEGLVIASTLYSLPFAVQPVAAAFRSIDRRMIEASWTLGVSSWGTFFRVIVPQAKAGLVAGFVLSFAHTVGEFGVVLMVGGNIPGVTRTISIHVYDEVQSMDYASAGMTSLALLVFSFLILSLVYSLTPRRDRIF
jgi:molybdate transport system permease protein